MIEFLLDTYPCLEDIHKIKSARFASAFSFLNHKCYSPHE